MAGVGLSSDEILLFGEANYRKAIGITIGFPHKVLVDSPSCSYKVLAQAPAVIRVSPGSGYRTSEVTHLRVLFPYRRGDSAWMPNS
jgi:hypothetical protein